MRIATFDIEGNNLYEGIDRFWCAWVKDPISGVKMGFRPHQFYEFISYLCEFDVLVGHNVVDFDVPALIKLGGKLPPKYIFDTIVLSRLLDPDRPTGHGLKAWGKELGVLKGDYGEQEEAWDKFTEDMYTYCEQDVEVTCVLYEHLCRLAGFDPANPPKSLLNFDELLKKFEKVLYEV